MDFDFNPDEVRVLGCLIEKRFSTPDSYPLSIKALIAACNQSSNRDPVVRYDQAIVNGALKNTRGQGYSLIATGFGSRVPKFEESTSAKLELSRPQAAILAELMLRGPQTPGELRQRCSRMYDFPDLETVDDALLAMAERERPLVVALPRQPGKREVRYAHLLAGPVEEFESPVAVSRAPAAVSRSSQLEDRVAALERQMAEVLEKLEELL